MSGGSPPGDLRAIAADPDAFEAFYRRHVEAVQRFVARRVGDREHAADLTAEVFVAAIESAAAYRPVRNGSAVAWLYGVARNVVANDRRRAGRERAATARVVGRRLVGDDDVARMDERLDAAAGARQLYAAMDVLSDGERAVLELVAARRAAARRGRRRPGHWPGCGARAAAPGAAPPRAAARAHDSTTTRSRTRGPRR